jgi:hypothetical protein
MSFNNNTPAWGRHPAASVQQTGLTPSCQPLLLASQAQRGLPEVLPVSHISVAAAAVAMRDADGRQHLITAKGKLL